MNYLSAIWPLIDANISDQLPKLYLLDSLNRTMCGGDMSPGSWGKARAAKRFPGYYRGLRERWMMESRCYFFCHMPKKWGYAYPRTPRKLRLCTRFPVRRGSCHDTTVTTDDTLARHNGLLRAPTCYGVVTGNWSQA